MFPTLIILSTLKLDHWDGRQKHSLGSASSSPKLNQIGSVPMFWSIRNRPLIETVWAVVVTVIDCVVCMALYYSNTLLGQILFSNSRFPVLILENLMSERANIERTISFTNFSRLVLPFSFGSLKKCVWKYSVRLLVRSINNKRLLSDSVISYRVIKYKIIYRLSYSFCTEHSDYIVHCGLLVTK